MLCLRIFHRLNYVSSDIIGQTHINQIFLLQKEQICYKLNHYKSGLFLKPEVGGNIN